MTFACFTFLSINFLSIMFLEQTHSSFTKPVETIASNGRFFRAAGTLRWSLGAWWWWRWATLRLGGWRLRLGTRAAAATFALALFAFFTFSTQEVIIGSILISAKHFTFRSSNDPLDLSLIGPSNAISTSCKLRFGIELLRSNWFRSSNVLFTTTTWAWAWTRPRFWTRLRTLFTWRGKRVPLRKIVKNFCH